MAAVNRNVEQDSDGHLDKEGQEEEDEDSNCEDILKGCEDSNYQASEKALQANGFHPQRTNNSNSTNANSMLELSEDRPPASAAAFSSGVSNGVKIFVNPLTCTKSYSKLPKVSSPEQNSECESTHLYEEMKQSVDLSGRSSRRGSCIQRNISQNNSVDLLNVYQKHLINCLYLITVSPS
ncbi:hypothetical protein Ciccas_010913 [Cichlidogyrus casuarinus]|uniref:Uncharacterized protein n=1 Tax=Cichlidogyrus casuarinus TaxID=1844966 RepID=A0ABD2PST0_9PLAT